MHMHMRTHTNYMGERALVNKVCIEAAHYSLKKSCLRCHCVVLCCVELFSQLSSQATIA